MNAFFRRFLMDSRRFRLAMIALGLLLTLGAALVVALTMVLHKSSWVVLQHGLQMQCEDIEQAMNDEANVPFLPHADRLSTLDGDLANPLIRHARLDSLRLLPGAIGAVCFVNGQSLETLPARVEWSWLADSLADLQKWMRRVRDDRVNLMIARVRFREYIHGRDTLFLMADYYGADGRHLDHRWSAGTYEPKQTAYLFGVVLDPRWIRQAVVDQLDHAFLSKDLFNGWQDNDRAGLGIIAGGDWWQSEPRGGDTIWWKGLRDLTGKAPYGHKTRLDWWTSNLWFRFRAVREIPADVFKDESIMERFLHHDAGYTPFWLRYAHFAVSIILLLSGAALIASLTQMRRQWLSRQIALEHLSHSIKTPVARLRLNSDTLLESRVVSPEVERDVVQSINRECGRLERSVQNAALAIQEGGLKPHLSPVNLADLLQELKQTWQAAFAQQHIALELDAKDNASGAYDRDLLLVMLDNLMDNALRHSRLNQEMVTDGCARVTIRLTQDVQNATIQICDTGAGIHPKDLKKIFRRFERGKDKALSGVSGLGLGLALSKEIAEVHGGTVIAENNPQGGACLTVTLPRG